MVESSSWEKSIDRFKWIRKRDVCAVRFIIRELLLSFLQLLK